MFLPSILSTVYLGCNAAEHAMLVTRYHSLTHWLLFISISTSLLGVIANVDGLTCICFFN